MEVVIHCRMVVVAHLSSVELELEIGLHSVLPYLHHDNLLKYPLLEGIESGKCMLFLNLGRKV